MKSFYRYYKPTIADGNVLTLNVFGRFLTLLSNTSTIDILISIGHQSYERLPQGISVELQEGEVFTELRFSNDSGATVTLEICISAGRIYDNRVVISGDLSVTDISDGINTPAPLALNAGNSYANTIAQNSNRKEVIIQNSGAVDVWAGDTNTTPASDRGIKIISNDSITMATTALITLKSNAETGQVSYMEMTKT